MNHQSNQSNEYEFNHVNPVMYMTAIDIFNIHELTNIEQQAPSKHKNKKVAKAEKKEKASSKASCASKTEKKENEKVIENQKEIATNIKQMKMDETDEEHNIKGYYKYSTIFK
jgi:hypothetical protein